jgi:hypothetical protein
VNDRARRIDVLQGLSPTELDTLQLRCQGKTAIEIALTQFVSERDARVTLGHLYDALWLTHLPPEQRLSQLDGWAATLRTAREEQLLEDRFRGYVPQPPSDAPSAASLAAVTTDDEVIESRRSGDDATQATAPPRRRGLPPWWPGVVAVVGLLVAGGLAFLALRDDDDDRGQVVVPTIDAGSAVAATATTAPAATATTDTEETVAVTATSAEDASPAMTPTSGATATPSSTATATATSPPPTPTPAIAYEANFTQDLNGWSGGEGWRVENGVLIFDGVGGSRTVWSPSGAPEWTDDYIVEAEILVNNGAYTSAVAGFAMRDSASDATPEGQVATVVSTGGWHTYRLEVRDGQALFSVDGAVVGDFSDARLASPDALGVFAVATQIQVRLFRVAPLS